MKIVPSFLTAVCILASVVTASAQTVSPDPVPTIITTAPYTINNSGYYQLGADLVVSNTTGNIITVNASNVTLDFAGHYISGPSNATTTSTVYGVASVERGNLIVRNGTIAYCYEGINFYGNNSSTTVNVNQTVDNMLVTYVSHIGINFQNTRYSRIMNCVVSNIGGATAANGTSNYGIYNVGTGSIFTNNAVESVTGANSQSGYGIYAPSTSYTIVAESNKVFNCDVGLANIAKYADTLTSGCTTAFSGGTSAGSTNN